MKKPATRRWLSMGIELEGSYTRDVPQNIASAVKGASAKRDGSISGLRGHMSEIVTRVHEHLDPLMEDVVKLYPDLINHTCGLHAHNMFTMMDHALLTEQAFFDYFYERWEKWGRANNDAMGAQGEYFWMRLRGRRIPDTARNYCEMTNKSVTQLQDSNQEHRYTALNFSAWHKYKTLECRLLPMMPTADLAVSAMRELSDIYDSYLNDHKFPTIKLYTEFKESNGKLVEEKTRAMPSLELQKWEYTGEAPSFELEPGPDVVYESDEIPAKYFWRPRGNKSLGEEL